MMKFMKFCNSEYGLKLATFDQLYGFSVTRISDFWAAVWKFVDVIHSAPIIRVVDEALPIYEIPKWFHGARLNYAENLLRRNDDGIALMGHTESSSVRTVTFKQLRLEVGRYSQALRAVGISKGDRVCALVPNCIESVVFMLATASLGAIWSSASTDFGQIGVLDRFKQIEPKVLIVFLT
jgi:acetoacetyl-CoA synthetase